MKKAIVLILMILFIPLNIYGASDMDYYNGHIKEIKEYYPEFNIGDTKRLIKLNSKQDTVDILKKLYGSIDEYSGFYTSNELGLNLFDKVELVEKSIEFEIIDNIGYIIIPTFYNGVYYDVLFALEYMDENNILNIVLDLRDNPGGDISESIKIAQLFVKEGLIAKIDYYSDELEDEEYYSSLKELKYKVIVIVNKETASAAELLTGAIKESKSGYIIGEKTFGKSRVQKLIPIMTQETFHKNNNCTKNPTINYLKATKQGTFINGKSLLGWAKLTVGNFYIRSGKGIEGKGIESDYIFDEKQGDECLIISCNKLFELDIIVEDESILNR